MHKRFGGRNEMKQRVIINLKWNKYKRHNKKER